jgi:DNA modification methylase
MITAVKTETGTFDLHLGDVIDILKGVDDNCFDGCLCDPPYGLKFMGKKWDYRIPGIEYWAEILRVLKPGAIILSFGGTRTYHRLTCAIEDAGFEIFDSILASVWMYGQGFPKSKNSLKPAWEPIICARKPPNGNHTKNLTNYGCGQLNISGGCTDAGRWPSNLILNEQTAESLDNETRHLSGATAYTRKSDVVNKIYGTGKGSYKAGKEVFSFNDSGGASRFFYCAKISQAERNAGIINNTHPTLKPVSLCRYLATLILPSTPHSDLLVPFCGTGSEMAGALLAGWSRVFGIDSDHDSISTARVRIPSLCSGSYFQEKGHKRQITETETKNRLKDPFD